MIQNSQTTVTRYGAVAQSLHWLTASLVVVAFITSVGGPEARVYSAAADYPRSLHELLGVAVFIVTIGRLLWRSIEVSPINRNIRQWMERASGLVQWTLYALLLLVPLTAVLGAWLGSHPLTLLGVGSFSPMLSESRPLGHTLAQIHGWLGDFLIWLAGLHAAAGLIHHFVMCDDVLLSMLPRFNRS